MSGASLLNPPWNARQQRAKVLQTRQPHAQELLAFYRELLSLQEPLYHAALAAGWHEVARAAPGEGVPRFRLERLPVADLLPRFQEFVETIAPPATDLLATAAESLLLAGHETHAWALTHFLTQEPLEELASALGCGPLQLEFFPRAFVQPIAEALVEPADDVPTEMRSCPYCSRLPQVAAIRNEPDIKGRRVLVCSLCIAAWPFPRSTCPNCGETKPEQLIYHVGESMPHVRVEECRSCGVYVKSVDLREMGTAVPLVDDVASVELDVWCDEQGLRKLQRNVLGL